MAKGKSHFFQVPNFIDDALLSPRAFRLYCHILRVCGDDKICTQGLRTLSKWCKMATNTMRSAKSELIKKGLIQIKQVKTQNGYLDEIHLTDVWELNKKVYDGTIKQLPETDAIVKTAKVAETHFKSVRSQSQKWKFSDSFEITEEMEKWATKNAPNVDIYNETERFIEMFQSKETKSSDWSSIWKKWMLIREKG